MNNKGADQTVWMRRLICAFIVRIWHKQVFLWHGSLKILFRITWWPSAGKELSPWLSTHVVFILCCLNYICSFPFRCLGQDVESDCIGSWSLPFSFTFFKLRIVTAFFFSILNFSDLYGNHLPNERPHNKTSKMTCPAMTQISLGIRPVWSESSLCAQWVAEDPVFLHVDSQDSDQTGWMPKLIWVFGRCIVILLVLSCHEVAQMFSIITLQMRTLWNQPIARCVSGVLSSLNWNVMVTV